MIPTWAWIARWATASSCRPRSRTPISDGSDARRHEPREGANVIRRDRAQLAGRALLEAGGLEAVTMQAVAQRVGVRAPSLYKRVPSRAALIAAIGRVALDDLARSISPWGEDPDAAAGLRAVAAAYRAFAHANPRAYEPSCS